MAVIVLVFAILMPIISQAVSYDIIYVRAPRYGDTVTTKWPEAKDPIRMEPNTDLMLLHSDGSQELLVAGGAGGAVIDPSISMDGAKIYYSKCPDVVLVNTQVGGIPVQGCDIYRMNMATRQETRLTFQEFTPNTGVANWCATSTAPSGATCNRPGYGVFNLGAHEISGNRMVFVSSRNGFVPNIQYTNPNLQLHIMDFSTGITHYIGSFNIGSALHPFPLQDGTIGFSTMESAHRRDPRLWGLWRIYPDGRKFAPLLSAYMRSSLVHFATQISDGRIVTGLYYVQNRQSFGSLMTFTPLSAPQGRPVFGSPSFNDTSNSLVDWGCFDNNVIQRLRFSFSPYDLFNLTAFSNAEDRATRCTDASGERKGAATHPSAAPENNLLLVWSNGPTKKSVNPQVDSGIYLMNAEQQVFDPKTQFTLILNNPNYNEQQPRALVSWQAIHGTPEPPVLPWTPREDERLLPGEAVALFGSSSLCWRDTDAEPPNVSYRDQGSSIGKGRYSCDDIEGLRMLGTEATSHVVYGTGAYGNNQANWFEQDVGFNNERMRILGEVYVKKIDPAMNSPIVTQNPDGTIEPDTSFLLKIPCDMSLSFQTLDNKARPLNHSSTWHRFACGSKEVDCAGCHAHAHVPKPFSSAVASHPSFPIVDMVQVTPLFTPNGGLTTVASPSVTYEYNRDVLPILTRIGLPTDYNANLLKVSALNVHDSVLMTDAATAGATDEEMLTLTRWISLGAPRNKAANNGGWFIDDQRPALHLHKEGDTLYVGVSDNASGVDISSLSVTLNGEILVLTAHEKNTWSARCIGGGLVIGRVKDMQGNWTENKMVF